MSVASNSPHLIIRWGLR